MSDRDPPRATVQLWHELPDGTGHVDWLLARSAADDPDDDQRLITFRLPSRLDEAEPGETIEAERIGDHRRVYLTYEGEVSGGRGAVRRLVDGEILGRTEDADRWTLAIAWNRPEGRGVQHLRLERDRGPIWSVCIIRPDASEMNL